MAGRIVARIVNSGDNGYYTVPFGNDLPDGNDQYLKTVGMLVQNAALSDKAMFYTFMAISGCSEPLAKAVFYVVESIHAKASLITRVLTAIGADAEDRRLCEEITKFTEPIRDFVCEA